MNIDKIPVIGKINQKLSILMINFILLAFICLILGFAIPFYPQILDVLVSALLIIAAIILINIAWNIHSIKKKYFGWIDKDII